MAAETEKPCFCYGVLAGKGRIGRRGELWRSLWTTLLRTVISDLWQLVEGLNLLSIVMELSFALKVLAEE